MCRASWNYVTSNPFLPPFNGQRTSGGCRFRGQRTENCVVRTFWTGVTIGWYSDMSVETGTRTRREGSSVVTVVETFVSTSRVYLLARLSGRPRCSPESPPERLGGQVCWTSHY